MATGLGEEGECVWTSLGVWINTDMTLKILELAVRFVSLAEINVVLWGSNIFIVSGLYLVVALLMVYVCVAVQQEYLALVVGAPYLPGIHVGLQTQLLSLDR